MRILLCTLCLPFLAGFLLLLNVVQMLSLALLPFSARAFRAVNRHCAGLWFKGLGLVVWKVRGVEFVFTGDLPPEKENAFVVANHQSMADIPALVVLAVRCRRTKDLKWFVKDVIKWVPGIGWGMLFLDCLFLKRNWSADKEKILSTFERLRRNRVPFWILSFAEGTRLTPAKLARSQEYCRKAGLPVPRFVMSPRTRGFEATLEGLGELAQAVYDVTIAFEGYPVGEVPGLGPLFFGGMDRVHLHVRRFPIGEIPKTKEGRTEWILARFVEKDERMARFLAQGSLA